MSELGRLIDKYSVVLDGFADLKGVEFSDALIEVIKDRLIGIINDQIRWEQTEIRLALRHLVSEYIDLTYLSIKEEGK